MAFRASLQSQRCELLQQCGRPRNGVAVSKLHHRRKHRGQSVVPLSVAADVQTAADAAAASINPPASAAAGSTPGVQAQPDSRVEPINWYKQWYPVAILRDLDPKRPVPVSLLGQDLVLWRDGSGSWQALQDRCPHRLAPLSEGRIDNGNLACAYHGWEFDGQGRCVRIPQLAADSLEAGKACSNGKACVKSYPVLVEQGLIWVWGEAGPAAAGEAAAAQPLLVPELQEGSRFAPQTEWFVREIPTSLETTLENVCDPSHVNFTHHKVQGSRQSEKGSTISMTEPLSPQGFTCRREPLTPDTSGRGTFEFSFRAPGLIRYEAGLLNFVVWGVPTKPGWMLMFARFFYTLDKPMPPPLKILNLISKNRVAEHILRNTVLDGDGYLLHVQERALLREGNAWNQSYYMPSKADTGTGALRRWFDTYGRAFPLLPRKLEDLPPQLTREQALDRHTQHVKHCSDCQQALRRVDALAPLAATVAAAAGLVGALALFGLLGPAAPGAGPAAGSLLAEAAASNAAVAAVVSAAAGVRWGLVAGCAVLAALAAGANQVLGSIRRQLTFTDYVHAYKD